MNIKKVLQSGSVVRYHSTLIDKKQGNDQHSWEVAVILEHIYPDCSKDLLFHALVHDAAEIHTSDVAAPVKRDNPEMKSMLDKMEEDYMGKTLRISVPVFSYREKLALKYADLLSGLYYTTRRVNAGDQEAIPISDNWLAYLGSMPYLNETTETTIQELKQ